MQGKHTLFSLHNILPFIFLRLLYDPVTVTCGHSFCLQCLNRTFDHSPFCPICRTPLGEVRAHTHSLFLLPNSAQFPDVLSAHKFSRTIGELYVNALCAIAQFVDCCMLPQPVDSTLILLIKHFFLCQYNEKSAQVIGDFMKRARLVST